MSLHTVKQNYKTTKTQRETCMGIRPICYGLQASLALENLP